MDQPGKLDSKEEDKSWLEDWNRRRLTAVAQVLCYVTYAVYLRSMFYARNGRDKSENFSKGIKRKASEEADCKKQFESIREATSNVAEAIREGNAIIERSQTRFFSGAEVFAELTNIGFEKKTLYSAYIYLMEDDARVRAFFGCPAEERKNFLLQMMHAPPGFIRNSHHV